MNPLEMQIRALREALEHAVKAGEEALREALREAHALRESLLCERLRLADLQMRHKQLQQFHKAATVGESQSLQDENRRLRTLLAEASREPARQGGGIVFHSSAERVETAESGEEPEVTFGA